MSLVVNLAKHQVGERSTIVIRANATVGAIAAAIFALILGVIVLTAHPGDRSGEGGIIGGGSSPNIPQFGARFRLNGNGQLVDESGKPVAASTSGATPAGNVAPTSGSSTVGGGSFGGGGGGGARSAPAAPPVQNCTPTLLGQLAGLLGSLLGGGAQC